MMMIILDGTIVTVALPAIQRDLGFSSSGLAWVVNAYLIAFGGLLLLAGRLGDLIGGKRVFLAGLAVFIAASLLCGLSVSQPMLIAARFAQGAGGALASAVSLGMIVRLFPEPPLRARALGIYSFTGAGGASVGLVLGGVLTQALSWHWIFFVNVPIGAGRDRGRLAAAGWRAGDRPAGATRGADAAGALLVTAGLMTGGLRDRRDVPLRLGLRAHARHRRRRGGAAGRVLRPPAPGPHPAASAADIPVP